MTQQIRAALRAAVWQAIATLGEKEARALVESIFKSIDDDHWNPQRGGR